VKPPVDEFAAVLRNLRKVRGLSANDVAQRSGVASKTVHRWENFVNAVLADNVERVSAVLCRGRAERTQLVAAAAARCARLGVAFDGPAVDTADTVVDLVAVAQRRLMEEGRHIHSLPEALGWLQAGLDGLRLHVQDGSPASARAALVRMAALCQIAVTELGLMVESESEEVAS
jgi:transcriptional regulator with XRE-family HTH domain